MTQGRPAACRKNVGQAREEMGRIVAGIGVELIAAKEALDKTPDRTAWQRWLKGHVHYSIKTAQNYMSVARFAGKNESAFVFSGLEPTALYRLAALPDRKRKGSLTGASKQGVLEAIEHLRGIVLKWPAWAMPSTKKK